MRQRQVWRYYCDFCKKAGCSKGHMARHERGCTLNPNRQCGMCKQAKIGPHDLQELITIAKQSPAEPGDLVLSRLMDQAETCPACILASIRQAWPNGGAFIDETEEFKPFPIQFNYKKECELFWSRLNDKELREDAYYSQF